MERPARGGPKIGTRLHSPGPRAQLERQLARLGAIVELDGTSPIDRATAASLDVLVVEAVDAMGRSLAPLVVSLAATTPALPIVVYDRAEGYRLEALRATLVPGIGIEYVVWPFEPLAPTVRRALDGPFRPSAGPVVLANIIPVAPPDLHTFLTLAALKATTKRSVGLLAHWSNSSARTIERRLDRAGWATAHTVLQSFRALDTLWLMDEYRISARRVQQLRGFTHGSSLTRLTRRWAAGITPSRLHESGGFNAALDAVIASLIVREP